MMERLRILPMKVLAALALVLGYAPVFFMLSARFLPDNRLLWFLIPLAALLWGCIGYCLPRRGRLAFALTGCVMLPGALLLLLPPQGGLLCLVPVLPCIALMLMMLPAWSRPVWDEWHLAIWVIGAAVHLAVRIFEKMIAEANLIQVFNLCFLAYMFLFLMMMNRQSLRGGMHGSRKAPAAMRQRNQWLLTALFIPAVLASCWGFLGNGLESFWNWLKRIIGNAIVWFFSLLENENLAMREGPMEAPEAQMEGMMEAAGEPGMAARILETVLIVLACILILIAVCLALWFLGKKLIRLVRIVIARLRRFSASSAEDYVDEMESTLDMDEKKKILKEKLKKAFARPRQTPWEQLSGRERVRRLYQQFLQKHPASHGQTAREALIAEKKFSADQSASFASMYEKARYSDHPIDTNEADILRRQIR